MEPGEVRIESLTVPDDESSIRDQTIHIQHWAKIAISEVYFLAQVLINDDKSISG